MGVSPQVFKGDIAGIPCGSAKNKPKKNFALTHEKQKQNQKARKHPKKTKKNQEGKIFIHNRHIARFFITQFTTTFLPTYLTGTRENTPKREKTHPKTRKRTPKREKHSNNDAHPCFFWLKKAGLAQSRPKIYLPTWAVCCHQIKIAPLPKTPKKNKKTPKKKIRADARK